jgi:AmmeMemoRadiSam system protein B
MKVRPPVVAGMFYTALPDQLSSEVNKFLAQVKPIELNGTLLGLIVPHAGHPYSGLTAAYAYSLLRDTAVKTVVIISPSHREYFAGISVFDGMAYRTPLGEVPLDEELRDALAKDGGIIKASAHGHGAEHAIEVQLPFLQRVLPEFKIVPIVMGDQRREFSYHLGERLGDLLHGKPAILVASSDLSHYHSDEEARALDRIVTEDVEHFDVEALMDDLETERCEACGGGPMVAMLTAAKKLGADHTKILHRCNSGDTTGDRSAVVGYLSAAVVRTR